MATGEKHDQRLENARASDTPAFRGPPAGCVAGGKRNIHWPGITVAPIRIWLRSAQRNWLSDLTGFTRNIDVQVYEGNKVIEVRNSGINKGIAVQEWLAGKTTDFILGIGDDWTG